MRPLLLGPALALSSCIIVVGEGHDWRPGRQHIEGSGHRIEETRQVGDFHGVELDLAADAKVRVGGDAAVTIQGDDNIVERVQLEIDDGILRIRMRDRHSYSGKLRFEISTPQLSSFEIDGSGSVDIEGLRGEEFTASIDGSGRIHGKGSVRVVHADVDGSGEIQLVDVEAEEATIDIDGSGDVYVSAATSLDYDIDGAGNIRYAGSPRNVRGNIDGAGTVNAG